MASSAAAASFLAPTLEQLRHLAAELRSLLPLVRVGEAQETAEEFNREMFWRRLNEAAVNLSGEATILTTLFSRLPLPSPRETQRICEQIHVGIKEIIEVYYSLPKNQGITLRKLVRNATLDVVDGMAQLLEVLISPSQSTENCDLISCNSVSVACQKVSEIPKDNKAAALLMLTKCVNFVKDAHEEMEQAIEECDPYCGLLNGSEDNSDSHNDEDDVLGLPSNRDSYWSEEDQELINPCLALVRASRACLRKIRTLVAENGKKDQVSQLDDIVDISDEISPSVDVLVLSIYPPVCHLTVRINSAKLVSVLIKALEITKASHVTPQPEDSWIPLLINAIDRCMNRVKELTQHAANS
ncbi:cyclin-D1-binding protein 1 [Cricetulus griseus]|uniref:Cyclin-D1-binding protein 1 n=1 Tax=Cricetulus griseus TaxID=10029 RepID=G3H0W0_CRIGR|nr:cyclin-D1-binding protein 1 [Cricetulus griseus]XP_027277889.1 cyclin-D1-binding protein 1 [Cricetulus griseus]EGV97220.1 Cyclin-D1-binding protein 1 [Cricetulus griseus]ERE70846.1 cyclin-D1-binding protein 1 [Cricetulus griseus]